MVSKKSSTRSRKTKAKTGSKSATATAPACDTVIRMVENPAPNSDSPIASEPKLVTVIDPVVSEPDLKKRELIDLVVER